MLIRFILNNYTLIIKLNLELKNKISIIFYILFLYLYMLGQKMLISFKVVISSIILTLFFQGCGNGSATETEKTYATTLGVSASVSTTDTAAVMAPSSVTLKKIAVKIGTILSKDISAHNQTEATEFEKQTNYCDISGEKEFENLSTLQKITNITEYKNCKEMHSTENGKVKIEYLQIDNEGKYPKTLMLTINEDYTYNDIELKKGLTITSSITYDQEKKLKSISLKINGTVLYDHGIYPLLNSKKTITY